jgi:hypothetical protein
LTFLDSPGHVGDTFGEYRINQKQCIGDRPCAHTGANGRISYCPAGAYKAVVSGPILREGIVAGRRLVPPIRLPSAIAGHGSKSIALEAADPLEVNALLIVAGELRCLLFSFDLLYIGGALRRELLAGLSRRHGMPECDVFLFASHTHFAPPTDAELPDLGQVDDAYAHRVLEVALDLADELMVGMPTQYRMDARCGRLAHSVNRRRPRLFPSFTRTWGISFARVTLAPHPRGERNDVATVITLTDKSKAPIAVIWHYACHPVGHTPSQVTSADFPGRARDALRRYYGGGAGLPVLFLQGFCGDVRPNIESTENVHWRQMLFGFARDWIAGTPILRPTADSWRRWVDSLASEILRIAAAPPQLSDENMGLASTCADVPVCALFSGKSRIDTMLARGLRIGRAIEILAFGAEPSAGWQRRLEKYVGQSAGIRLYAGYSGDVIGYLPLPEQVEEGGYEVDHFQSALGMNGEFRKAELFDCMAAAVRSILNALRTEPVS